MATEYIQIFLILLSFCIYRQTIVLVYYFLCLLNMFLIRPVISSMFDVRGKAPIYSALYFLPLLTLIHGTCCGLICKLPNLDCRTLIANSYFRLFVSLSKYCHVHGGHGNTLRYEAGSDPEVASTFVCLGNEECCHHFCPLAAARVWNRLIELPLCVIVLGSVSLVVLHCDCELHRSWGVSWNRIAHLIRKRANADLSCQRRKAFHSCYLCVI